MGREAKFKTALRYQIRCIFEQMFGAFLIYERYGHEINCNVLI